MYSRFDSHQPSGRCRTAALTTMLLLVFGFTVIAQNYPLRVNLVVAPPYSPKISEYTSNPNKILATVQYMAGAGNRTLQVYLSGSITGTSGIKS